MRMCSQWTVVEHVQYVLQLTKMGLVYYFAFYMIVLVYVRTVQLQPYLQTYPKTDDRTPLHFALMLSFGGDYRSIGALPGVQIALDYINNEPSILPGYSLHYTLTDSQCNRSVALESLFDQITSEPTKVGWVGSGCSVATEPTAEITQFFNIPQVSCVSSSSELKNRQRFRYYFQLLAAESQIAQGFFKIIRNFGWKRIQIIIQNENLFTVTMDVLKALLIKSGVELSEKLFKTEDGIGGVSGEIFDPDIRIYVVAMYSSHARDLLCKAYEEGIAYPRNMLITYGWYGSEWWTGEATSSQFNCTPAQRASVLAYTLAPQVQESYTDLMQQDVSGINAAEYIMRYQELVNDEINENIALSDLIPDASTPFYYSQHCHEATLAFAFALNKTITELENNMELNEEATMLFEYLPNGTKFRMEHFHYNNSVIVREMAKHLQNSSFQGLSGNTVSFDEDGIREVDVLVMYQYQWKANNTSVLLRVLVGNIKADTDSINIDYQEPYSVDNPGMWPDGIPNDGIPIEEVVTVSLGLTVVYVILAIAGLVFAVICLIFTLIFRKKKLIRLSSPNLNYIIGLGAIILYLNVITFVIPTTDPDFVSVLCNINPWLTSLGYSLCYGTILVKTIRIWYIFNKPRVPTATKSFLTKDYVLILFVLCLVVIDVLILGSYTAIEGSKGQLGVRKTSNKENLEEIMGSTSEIHHYNLYICESKAQIALFTVLFGYKGLLQVIALILAFSTRKVKVKGLDDSKYIAAAIYVTSIVLAVTTVSTYTLMDYVNVYPTVVGMGFLLGTTMILGLVFVPRMIGLYQDPKGENVKIVTTEIIKESRYSPEVEIRLLRHRISELERNQPRTRNLQIGSLVNMPNPDYMASSPSTPHGLRSEQYHSHQLHICTGTGSQDSSKDNPLYEAKRNTVRWSHDLSLQSPT